MTPATLTRALREASRTYDKTGKDADLETLLDAEEAIHKAMAELQRTNARLRVEVEYLECFVRPALIGGDA